MSRRSRRSVLGTSAAVLTATAGCLDVSGSAGTDASPTLTTSSSVLRQPTPESPPRVELRLTNTSSDPLVLRAGGKRPFVVLPSLDADGRRLFCIPRSTPNSVRTAVAETRTEGCWRFVAPDGTPAEFTELMNVTETSLGAGETHIAVHDLYDAATEGSCLVGGEYSTTQTVSQVFPESDREREELRTFRVALTVEDGRLGRLVVE